jgi:3-dehydroquinate dehydratase-1/3-dehydroquinate dehydratase/shikimate dehydrogenase
MTISSDKKICVSIGAETAAAALNLAQANQEYADVIEIRLDGLDNPDPALFVKALTKPVLFTCRAQWEGGLFTGDEDQRIDILKKAAASGAAYVDVELNTDEPLRKELITLAREKGVKSIVSWHNFDRTGSSQALEKLFQHMYRSGADIGKLVTTARDFKDVLRILSLQEMAEEMGFALIAFCMGATGTISRVATLFLGGYMTYVAPDQGRATAPGQIAASVMKNIVENLNNA